MIVVCDLYIYYLFIVLLNDLNHHLGFIAHSQRCIVADLDSMERTGPRTYTLLPKLAMATACISKLMLSKPVVATMAAC